MDASRFFVHDIVNVETETQTHRHTDGRTDRPTDRQTDRQTERHTERQRQRERTSATRSTKHDTRPVPTQSDARSFLPKARWSTLWVSSGHALRSRATEELKGNVSRTFTFIHEVTGTEQVNRLTATPLYDAVYNKFLTSSEPGKPVKQAPWFPVGLLALLENFLMDSQQPRHEVRLVGASSELGHDAFLGPSG